MASARTKIRVFRQDGTPVAEYLLGEGVHSVGRDPSSAIYLESNYISSEHARLHLSATGIEIEDLNSPGGTYLDGVTVRGKLDIQPGQRLQVGDLLVDFTMESSGKVVAGVTLGAGRYTLVQELGRGAMGTVWLATDNEFNEDRAIKLLAPELAGDTVTLADLKREVQKSRRLSHEHIIRIHDLSNLPGEMPFITMEFIRGSNMDTVRLNQPDGLMSWKHLRSVLLQLAEALDYAHRQKIVHRDLKPANMMVTEDYTLKLADFGIAATLNDSTTGSSMAGTVSGTLNYMSPQQLQGEDPQGSDDIYSLGATLYNLIAGRSPFNSGDIRGQILNQSPTPLTQVLASAGVQSDIPDYVSSLVMACLAKDPEDRPQSGKAIVEWIVSEGRSQLIAKKDPSSLNREEESQQSRRAAKHNKKLVIGIVVAAIVVGLAVAGFLLVGKGDKGPSADSTIDEANSHSKYKEELAKIKSLGEPTTLADLNTWHKAVPAEKNSALAYLETRKSEPENWGKLVSEYPKAFSKWRRSKNFNPSAIRIHPYLLPSIRANLSGHNVHINQLLNFYATSPANQPARFAVDWNNGMSTELHYLTWLRRDVNLLVFRSRIFADAGHTEEAIRSILAIHRLAHLLDGEPCVISVSLQQSLYSSADAQIERLLNQFALNDAQLVALHQSIASFNVPAQYANALIGERCTGIATEETARNGSVAEIQRLDKHGEMLKEKLIQQLKNRSVADQDLDMTLFLEFHNSLIKLFKSGYPQLPASHEKYNENAKTSARISELNELIDDKSNPKYIISQMLLPALTDLVGKESKSQQWSLLQQLAGTAMAIERYRLANHTLPQSLNQLVPHFLSAMPVDPYSEGKPLRYAAGANGSFMLSSIESNNKKPLHPHPAPNIYTFGVNPALRGR